MPAIYPSARSSLHHGGRDADIAAKLLIDAGFAAKSTHDLASLCGELAAGAGLAIIADEALQTTDLRQLADLLSNQPSWSDFPIVVLTQRGAGPERNPFAARLAEATGKRHVSRETLPSNHLGQHSSDRHSRAPPPI
jgi:hypothetical protein